MAKYKRNDRVYSKAYGSNATVVAADKRTDGTFYIIRLDGSSTDSFNVQEAQLSKAK